MMLGKTEGNRRREQQRMRWSDSITDSTDMNFSKLQEIAEGTGAGVLPFIALQRVAHDLATEHEH